MIRVIDKRMTTRPSIRLSNIARGTVFFGGFDGEYGLFLRTDDGAVELSPSAGERHLWTKTLDLMIDDYAPVRVDLVVMEDLGGGAW